MKEIQLTKGHVVKVDDCDYDFLCRWKWQSVKIGTKNYATRKIWLSKGSSFTIYMHRQLVGICDYKIKIDHIDGDGLNNQSDNIRTSTHGQNSMNKTKQVRSATGIKGVYFNMQCKRYFTQIGFDGKQKYLGSFKTIEEAAKARHDAEKIYHGEFSYSAK